MVWWGTHADRANEHRLHTAAACLLNFAGLAVCIFLQNPILLMIAIIFSQMGQSAIAPTFWALPTAMLTGTAAAGGIAMINAVGNLGGFLGPYMMGAIKDATGSFPIGLLSIAMGRFGRHNRASGDGSGKACRGRPGRNRACARGVTGIQSAVASARCVIPANRVITPRDRPAPARQSSPARRQGARQPP